MKDRTLAFCARFMIILSLGLTIIAATRGDTIWAMAFMIMSAIMGGLEKAIQEENK